MIDTPRVWHIMNSIRKIQTVLDTMGKERQIWIRDSQYGSIQDILFETGHERLIEL